MSSTFSLFVVLFFSLLVIWFRNKTSDGDDLGNLTLHDLFRLRGHLLFVFLATAFLGWLHWSEKTLGVLTR